MRKILYFLCFLITVIIVYFIVDFSIPTKGVNLNTGVENDFVIAHAGGAIEGFNYTNSLEALNHAYDQGVRLFEMDILETSDGKLRSEEHTSELQSRGHLVCRLLLEKKNT